MDRTDRAPSTTRLVASWLGGLLLIGPVAVGLQMALEGRVAPWLQWSLTLGASIATLELVTGYWGERRRGARVLASALTTLVVFGVFGALFNALGWEWWP
jgi:hypothetical protein